MATAQQHAILHADLLHDAVLMAVDRLAGRFIFVRPFSATPQRE
jgi:hypothetical protein